MIRQIHNRSLVLLFCCAVIISLLFILISTMTAVAAPNGDYALYFDGSTDMVRLHETALIMNSNTWTITKSVSLWVKPEGATIACTGPNAAAQCDAVFGDRARWWGIARGNILGQDRLWVFNYSNTGENRVGIDYTIGEWVHVALVHDGGNLFAYKNGVLVGSTPSSATIQPNTEAQPILYIGGMMNNAFRNWTAQGQIDEVRIWNIGLFSAEVRRDMYKTLTGSETGLAAYYQFSDGSGISVTDNSGNGWTGTLLDGNGTTVPGNGTFPAWIASGAFTGPRQALDFDGTDDYVNLVDNGNTIIGAGWASTKSSDVWLRPTGAAPVVTDASLGDVILGGLDWGVSQANIGGQDRLWVWNDDGNVDPIPLSYTVNEWTHISLVHAGGNLTAYQDGQLVSTVASGNTASDGMLTIGGLSTGQNFQGQIDEVRIWNDARSATEIQDFMFQTVEFDAAGLAAYYRMDQENEVGQTEVVDSTNNGRYGTMINMNPNADWVASAAFNTWVGGDTIAWADGGNWSQYALSNQRLGVTSYPGSFASTVTSTVTVDDVVIVTGATLFAEGTLRVTNRLIGDSVTVTAGGALEMLPGSAITINNVLDNYGTLSQTKEIDGSGLMSYFATGGYGGVTIEPNGQNMGDTTVVIRGHQDCENGFTSVQRCFDIQPETNPGTGADLTFYFDAIELNSNSCASLAVYHWNGAGWDSLPVLGANRNCATIPYSVMVENVTAFSPFVLSSVTPTAVTLSTFNSENATNSLILLPIVFLSVLTAGVLLIKRKRQGNQLAA